jgi:hypothetical protein
MSTLSKFESPLKSLLHLAGHLFTHGYPVSTTTANQDNHGNPTAPFLVDTPEYPFDHSEQYWHETRLSRDWKLREAVPSSLLGITCHGLEPTTAAVAQDAER